MKRRKFLSLSAFLFAALLSISACNKQKTPEPAPDGGGGEPGPVEPGTVDPTEYYNEENFVEATKEVTATKLNIFSAPNLLTPSNKVSV